MDPPGNAVTEEGVKDTVAPCGNPLAERFTLPLNPFSDWIRTGKDPPPNGRYCCGGPTDIEKSGAVPEISVTLAVCVKAPLVPVIVSVVAPEGIAPFVVTVRTEIAEPLSVGGVKEAVAFAGNPLTARLTLPVKPFNAVTPTMYFAVDPLSVWEAGTDEREKSGVDPTTRPRPAVCVRTPLVPVTVRKKVPTGVAAVVRMVSVEKPEEYKDTGLNEAVAPAGSPLTERFTLPVNPPAATISNA